MKKSIVSDLEISTNSNIKRLYAYNNITFKTDGLIANLPDVNFEVMVTISGNGYLSKSTLINGKSKVEVKEGMLLYVTPAKTGLNIISLVNNKFNKL